MRVDVLYFDLAFGTDRSVCRDTPLCKICVFVVVQMNKMRVFNRLSKNFEYPFTGVNSTPIIGKPCFEKPLPEFCGLT